MVLSNRLSAWETYNTFCGRSAKKICLCFLACFLNAWTKWKSYWTRFSIFPVEQSFRGLSTQYVWKNYGENKGTIRSSAPQHCLLFPYTNTAVSTLKLLKKEDSPSHPHLGSAPTSCLCQHQHMHGEPCWGIKGAGILWVSLQLDWLADLLTMPSYSHAGTAKKPETGTKWRVRSLTLSNCRWSQWNLGLYLRDPSVAAQELSGDLRSPPIRNKKVLNSIKYSLIASKNRRT